MGAVLHFPVPLAAAGWWTDHWTFVLNRLPELGMRFFEHAVYLTLIPVSLAIVIGVTLGLLITRVPWLRNSVLAGVGVIQTLPSLALLALLLPILGIGIRNAIVALTLYALLPIVSNTCTGILGVPPETVEAARGLGFTRRQRLWLVQLPLASPVIIAGIRTAAVIDVGIATLAAFIGAGGLGQFIVRGLQMNNFRLTTLGAVAAVLLALAVFGTIGLIEKYLSRRFGVDSSSQANQ